MLEVRCCQRNGGAVAGNFLVNLDVVAGVKVDLNKNRWAQKKSVSLRSMFRLGSWSYDISVVSSCLPCSERCDRVRIANQSNQSEPRIQHNGSSVIAT